MIILGIDPGFSVTGFGILKKQNSSVLLLDYGDLRMSCTKSLAVRVRMFHDFFTQKITQWQVTNLAKKWCF